MKKQGRLQEKPDCIEEQFKETFEKGFYNALSNMVNSNEKCRQYVAQFNGQIHRLYLSEIYYLESYQRKTSVVTSYGKIRVMSRLDEEEQHLPSSEFIRVNRHNIINMEHIKTVYHDNIIMENGEIVYISRTKKKAFLEVYMEYLKERGLILQI